MFKKRNIYIMIIFFLIIILEKMFNKFDPYLQDLKNTNLGMFKKGHILGTDILGRDILSRLTQGLMITIFIILIVYALSVSIGIVIGFLVAYYS